MENILPAENKLFTVRSCKIQDVDTSTAGLQLLNNAWHSLKVRDGSLEPYSSLSLVIVKSPLYATYKKLFIDLNGNSKQSTANKVKMLVGKLSF